ncbi:LysM peptidoglycan-binding domain-containing protein [Bifidobacterium sp. W8109]|uniref:LysM peptidoglycan-binding domain-containing protein n=1 Tax=Bifidobacterium TaxID=1678 RepID=UPI0018DD1116|nr:LysM peptidoglycan-binding domain-containing protein [Bifidobacterium asteroides]MBI0073322.1 LysM peptidoglycan-binding domain-containing protein [Bifidobacterium sp. W8110]
MSSVFSSFTDRLRGAVKAWHDQGFLGVIVRRFGVFLAVGALTLSGFGWMARPASSAPGPQEVITRTVRPGDNVWSYAASITPQGEDVAKNVDRIMQINNMSSPNLRVGDRILIPGDD